MGKGRKICNSYGSIITDSVTLLDINELLTFVCKWNPQNLSSYKSIFPTNTTWLGGARSKLFDVTNREIGKHVRKQTN